MNIHDSLILQYGAALAMLRQAIELCPESSWNDVAFANRFWQIAYHALFYTHLYVSPSESEFEPWEKGQPGYQYFEGSEWAPDDVPHIDKPYTKAELFEYHDLVSSKVAELVRSVPLESPSGFSWISFDRFQLHIYNIRHTQHHVGQLVDRVRNATGKGVEWIGRKAMNNE